MLLKCIFNNFPKQLSIKTSSIIRTKIHPTPSKVKKIELIQGRSKVGKPFAFEPYRVDIEKGKSYSWCSCGESKKQPFCDGSHKKLNLDINGEQDKFVPLRFTCEESRTALFCMCKSSSNRPFCDGTHEQIKPKGKKII